MKTYFYLYKITNNVNNHFYYGIHKTSNLDDGYMGSGKRLHAAYKKYGIENFTKEIIQYCNDWNELCQLEKSIVTEELVNDNNCYNMVPGGYYLDEELLKHIGQINSEKQKGEKNSQYNTVCIYKIENNVYINKRIKREDLEIYLSNGWNKGFKVNDTTKHKIASSNKVWIHNNDETKFIQKDKLQYYLDKGYKIGRTEKTENKIERKIGSQKDYSNFYKTRILVEDNNGNRFFVDKTDERYLNGELKSYYKNKISAIDKNGNKIGLVDKNDPRFKTGEIIKFKNNDYEYMKNKVIVKDDTGNKFFVDKTDERYISGELVGVNKNKHWKQKGTSPHKGRKWMYKDGEVIRLPKEKFEEYLKNGWKFGKPR
jgi:hypothetical protein